MTKYDPMVSLRQMLDNAQEAVDLLNDQNDAQVMQNRLLELALVRLVEVVGEAASRIPEDFREANSQIPWREAKSMRNMLIHGYDIVRSDILCNTIRYDLPPLIKQINDILNGAN